MTPIAMDLNKEPTNPLSLSKSYLQLSSFMTCRGLMNWGIEKRHWSTEFT